MTKTEANKMLFDARTVEKTREALAAGADVNAKDVEGVTPLMYAETPGQTRLLIAAGADVNAKDVSGATVSDVWHSYPEIGERWRDNQLIEGEKVLRYEKIEEMIKRLQSTGRSLKGKKSGAVFADAIAKMKRSGKIKGDVTPTMAKKLRTQWMKDMASNGKK